MTTFFKQYTHTYTSVAIKLGVNQIKSLNKKEGGFTLLKYSFISSRGCQPSFIEHLFSTFFFLSGFLKRRPRPLSPTARCLQGFSCLSPFFFKMVNSLSITHFKIFNTSGVYKSLNKKNKK